MKAHHALIQEAVDYVLQEDLYRKIVNNILRNGHYNKGKLTWKCPATLCRMLCSTQETDFANEVLGESVKILAEKVSSLRNVNAYFCKIIAGVTRDMGRKRECLEKGQILEEDLDVHATGEDVWSPQEARVYSRLLERAINSVEGDIGFTYRLFLTLSKNLEGEKSAYRKLFMETGIKESTARGRVKRARKQVEQVLRRFRKG